MLLSNRSLLHKSFILLLVGLLLLATATWVVGGIVLPSMSIFIQLTLAAFFGLLLRSMRRVLFFRETISTHRSFSYEIVVQLAQMISPLLPRRAFETAFLERESLQDLPHIQQWAQVRSLSTPVIIIVLFSMFLLLSGADMLAGITAIIALVVALFAKRKWQRSEDLKQPSIQLFSVIGSGLVVWGLEGALFVWITMSVLPVHESMLLYLLFTGFYEFSMIPLALGVVELPALLVVMSGHGAEALGILIVWHLMRFMPVLLLSIIYLPRYKLSFNDLLHSDIVEKLCETQRPVSGWPYPAYDASNGAYLSIVIPAYNEEERLPSFLDDVKKFVQEQAYQCEVLVVDDGSADATAKKVEEMCVGFPELKLLCQRKNQGKGAAVQRGMMEAKGYYILFSDADGATPIVEATALLQAVERGSEVSIGSRREENDDVQRERAGLRSLMGLFFYSLVNVLAVPRIKDTQCGFKLFRHDVAKQLFEHLNEPGWAFDVEVLYRAQLASYAIAEVPVNWSEIPGSKVSPVKDGIRMLFAIFRIRRKLAGYIQPPETADNRG